MKKLFNLALLGAIALTGAVGFSSCSSSSDEVINNPDYNPEQNSVKTQFTISFPKNVASTRQSAATVQNDQDIASFRGMDNIVLLPFATTGDVNIDYINITKDSRIDTTTGDVIIKNTTEMYIDTKTSVGDTNINNNYRTAEFTLNIRTTTGDIDVKN